jgi:Glycoside-hydrolase family GH114
MRLSNAIRAGICAAVVVLAPAADVLAQQRAHATARPMRHASLPPPVPCTGGPCWVPTQGMQWEWQICCYQGANLYPPSSYSKLNYVNTSYNVPFYDIDGFENDNNRTIDPKTGQPIGTVARLHAQGRRAICYLDVGSFEDWRPDWGKHLRRRHPGLVGAPVPDWPHQWWIDFRKTRVIYPIMRARLDMCRRRGYDGVQFDDLVAYEESKQGFSKPITGQQTVAYAVWLANQAHRRGLSAAFQNALEIAKQLQPYYDWALFEDCTQYQECHHPGLRAFLTAHKFVADVEYTDNKGHSLRWCGTLAPGTVGMLKQRLLDAPRWACP